jgi:hypothetical protein
LVTLHLDSLSHALDARHCGWPAECHHSEKNQRVDALYRFRAISGSSDLMMRSWG